VGSKRLKPREQGDIGELSAMEWLASKGAHIYVPIGHSPDVDLIAEVGDRLLRVEVKTSNCRNERGSWNISIATHGGNQSWTGLVKVLRGGSL
jgi:Holliday junction resolvase-like predicted endonuclease